jgi:chromosome segregation ATPase
MIDQDPGPHTSAEGGGTVKYVMLAVAGIYVLLSLYVMFDMRGRIATLEEKQGATTAAQQELEKKINQTGSSLKASIGAVADKAGMTEQQLAEKTKDLQRSQKASEARLAQQQKEQIGAVSGQVEGVKTEVGGVKTDLTSTKADLEATKAKLERAVGDLGQQSGLIARTREDLEYLKHRGDRNYFEFTLTKKKRQPVSTISLELKKTDPKKSKFTLTVLADDKTIEKKDKTVAEPLQFYSGRDRQLFELVVFTVDKDKVTGYLSTPKTAAAAPQGN